MLLPDCLFGNFFQAGYVTSDLPRATEIFRRKFGVGDFLTFDTASIAGAPANLIVALAWVGDLMVELVQPIGPPPPLYADALPGDGFSIRLHHHGYLCPDAAAWAGVQARIEAEDLPIVHRTASAGLFESLYADARPLLGHFIEYCHLEDAGRRLFASIPGAKRAT